MVLRFLVGLGLAIGLVLGTGLVLRLGLGFGWEGAIAITGHVLSSPLCPRSSFNGNLGSVPASVHVQRSEKKPEEEEEEDATVDKCIVFQILKQLIEEGHK